MAHRISAMAIDHDQIFKNLIEAVFREFMQLFFASIAELIDFSCVEFLRKEYFTDVQACRTTIEIKSMPTPIAIELKAIPVPTG